MTLGPQNPQDKNGDTLIETVDYRHADKRKNIPPAKMKRQGKVPKTERAKYHYNPHLPPELRFDPTGSPDKLPALLAASQKRPLTGDVAKVLAGALKGQRPWLEWAGKREEHDRGTLSVNPVALQMPIESAESTPSPRTPIIRITKIAQLQRLLSGLSGSSKREKSLIGQTTAAASRLQRRSFEGYFRVAERG